jgi:hypothetical protein
VRAHLPVLLAATLIGCTATDDPGVDELDPGGEIGKADGVGVAGLAVSGDYNDTQAWTVLNQWEDTSTPAAQEAGIAWAANSGLNWDEKFSRWVGSLPQIDAVAGSYFKSTIAISTPFGKSVPGPKIDCADLSILLRLSFAAWYRLPIYLVGYDAGGAVYFGHFGIRTASGPWSRAPMFAQAYTDYSESLTPAQYQANWPQDTGLRSMGVSKGDELPFLNNQREGAFLDEIHLNKRAARLVIWAQMYLGSHNLTDSRNTYNLKPESLRTGDFLMFSRAPKVDGHTTIAVRVKALDGGRMQAEAVYGNDPPAQPQWQDPSETRSLFTDDESGSPALNTAYDSAHPVPYSHLNGGLKRWRVAKAVAGRWMNTWMAADQTSWINDTNYDAIGARPGQFADLLGDPDPAVQRDLLLAVIADKRNYLTNNPSSCAARAKREETFGQLYAHMAAHFGMDRAAVDEKYRVIDDYVFAALDYSQSPTCCWNSTNSDMYSIIMGYVAAQQATACMPPPVFRMEAGGYGEFAAYAKQIGKAAAWKSWSADETCAAAGRTGDVVLPSDATDWCTVKSVQDKAGGGGAP